MNKVTPMKVKQAVYQMAREKHAANLAHEDAVSYTSGGVSVHCEVKATDIEQVTETGNIEPASYNPDGSVATYDVFYWYAYPPQ